MPRIFRNSLFVCLFFSIFTSKFSDAIILSRIKRQTAVSTNAETNGKGDIVDTDASAHHYKNSDGVVGMNVTSMGSSNGTNSSSVTNNANGAVGAANLNTTGNVISRGSQAESLSDIFAVIEGENKKIDATQQGKASGVGETYVKLSGGGQIIDENGTSKNANSAGNVGGTGSLGSQSEIFASQSMTWDGLMSQLVASAVAEGMGNAQSNIDLSAGDDKNNMAISGLVSGTNNNKGAVSSQVNGNGNLDGNESVVVGNMYGSVEGKGDSSLLGASSVNSNSSTGSEIRAFGNGNARADGNNTLDLQSETSLENEKGNGVIISNGTGKGSKIDLVSSNGLKINDFNGETVAIGSGGVNGIGSDANSNAQQFIETSYDADGRAQIFSNGAGNSLSNDGTNSSLGIRAGGNIVNSPNTNNGGTANGFGFASGGTSNVTGNGSVNMTGSSTGGSSMMQASGGGVGPSAAETNANLVFSENGALRNRSVSGGVSAVGDNTNVQSLSMISQNGGVEVLSNYQKASASAAGSSNVSASNSGLLKRRRKRSA